MDQKGYKMDQKGYKMDQKGLQIYENGPKGFWTKNACFLAEFFYQKFVSSKRPTFSRWNPNLCNCTKCRQDIVERATDTEEILRFNNDSVVILDFLLLIIFQICFSSSPQFFNPQELMPINSNRWLIC